VFTQSALSIVEDVASAGAAKAKAGAKVFKRTADTAEPAERPAKAAKAPAKAKKSEAVDAPVEESETAAVRGFADVAETGATSASEKPDASASEQSNRASGTPASSPDASASEQSGTASEQSNWAGSAHANEDASHPAGYDIKGNADSMLYHLPDGRWYDATVAEVWFDTEDSAVAAGFTKAGTKKTTSDETESVTASPDRSDDEAEPGVASASEQPDASESEQS